MIRAHSHFPAEDLLVVFAANRGDGDVSANSGDDLKGLFDCVVIGFIDRIDQLVALDVISSAVESDLIFRSIRYSPCAN